MPSGSKNGMSKKPPPPSPNTPSPTSASTDKAPSVQTVDVMPDEDPEEVDTPPSPRIPDRSIEVDGDGNKEVAPEVEKPPVQQGHANGDLSCLSSDLDLVIQPVHRLQNEDGEVVGTEFAEKIASEQQTAVNDHLSVAFVVPDEPPMADEDCEDNLLPLSEADADANETRVATDAIQKPVDVEVMKRHDTLDEVEAKLETEPELLIDTKGEDEVAVRFEQRVSPLVGIVGGNPTFNEVSQAAEVTTEGLVLMASDLVEAEVYSEEVASVEQVMPSISIQQTEVEVESDDTIAGTVWGAGCTVEVEGNIEEPRQAEVELETTLEGDGTNEESFKPSVTEDEYEITTGDNLTEEGVPAVKAEATEESGEDEVKVEPTLKTGKISEESMLNKVKIEPTLEAKEIESEELTQEPFAVQVEVIEESDQAEAECGATLDGGGNKERSLTLSIAEDESEIITGEVVSTVKNETTIQSCQGEVKVEPTMGAGETREECWQDDVKIESTLEAEEADSEGTIEGVLSTACTTESEAIEESSKAEVEFEAALGGRTNGESFQISVAKESETVTGESLTEEAMIAVKGQDTEAFSQGEAKVEPTLEAKEVDSEYTILGAVPGACSTEAEVTEESSQVELEATLGGHGTLKEYFQPPVAEDESEITTGESLTEEAVTGIKGQDTEESSQDEIKIEPILETEMVDSEVTIEGAVSAACTTEADVTEESNQAKVELEATLEGGDTIEESFKPFIAEDESENMTGETLTEEAVTTVKGQDTEESSQDEVKVGSSLEAGKKNEEFRQDEVVVEPILEASENNEDCGQDELKVEFTMGGVTNEEPRQEEAKVEPITEQGRASEETRQGEVKVESNMGGGGTNEQAVWLSLVEDKAEINTGGELTEKPILATCTTGDEVIEEYGLDGLEAETSFKQDRNYESNDEHGQDEVNVSTYAQEKETIGVSLQPSVAEEAEFSSQEIEEYVQLDLAKDKTEVATEENEHTGECLKETVEPVGLAIDECVQPSHTEEFRADKSSATDEAPDADSYEAASGQYVLSSISEDDEPSAAVDEVLGRHFIKEGSEAIDLGTVDKCKSSGNKKSVGLDNEAHGQNEDLNDKHEDVDERAVELMLPKFEGEMVISGNSEPTASEFVGVTAERNSIICRASFGSPESVNGSVINEVERELPIAFSPNPKDAWVLVDMKEEIVQLEASHSLVSEAPEEVERTDSVNWQEDMAREISEPIVLVVDEPCDDGLFDKKLAEKELPDEVETPLQLYSTAISSAVESSGSLADKSELELPLQDYEGNREVINKERVDDSLQVIESGPPECEPSLFTSKELEGSFGREVVSQKLENGENVRIGAPMCGLVAGGKFEFSQLHENPGKEKASIEENLPSGSMFEGTAGSVDQSLKKEQEGLKREFHSDDLLRKEDKAISDSLHAPGDKEESPIEFGGDLTEAVLVPYDIGGHGPVGSSPFEALNTVTSTEVILPLASCVPEKDVHVDQRSLKQEDTTRMQFPNTVMRKSNWWGCCGMLDVLLQRE